MGAKNSTDEGEPIDLASLSSRELADSLEKLGSDYKEYRNAIINSGISGRVIDELETTEEIQAILKEIKVHKMIHSKVITTHLLTLKYGSSSSIHSTPRMKLNFSNKSLNKSSSAILEPLSLESPKRNRPNSPKRNNMDPNKFLLHNSNGKYGFRLESPSKGSTRGNITFEPLSAYDERERRDANNERLLEPYTYMKREGYYGEQNEYYHPHGKGMYKYASGSVYEGDYLNGIPHGLGKITWTVTFDVYEGEFYEGTPHGKGVYSYHQLGEEYDGDFIDGKQHGIGTYTFNPSNTEGYMKYMGPWDQNIRSGSPGIMYFRNGDKYEGDFTDGFMEGTGKMEYKNGNLYLGEFKKNKMHGKGKFEWNEGKRKGDCYFGDFKNNKRDGEGIYLYTNRDRYQGNFKDGEMDGKGIFTWNSGASYVGDWKKDLKHGDGIYKYFNGDVYKGPFKDNEMHGIGEYKFANGSVFIGYFSFGDRNGEGILKYADGDVFFGHWKDDKKCGYGRYIYCSDTFYDGDYSFITNLKRYEPITINPTQEQLYIMNIMELLISRIRSNVIRYYGPLNIHNNNLLKLFMANDQHDNGTLSLQDFEKVLLLLKLDFNQEEVLKIFHYFNRDDIGLDYRDLLYALNKN